MAGIEIVTVTSRSELKDFIDLPWTIYADYPQWVPPLKKEVRRMLDPGTHPFWEFSERILFLARRGKKNVGRIAGIIDRHHNEFHREQMGIWGFFECADDPEAALALFSSVESWVRRKEMTFVRGPLNPSLNYEAGLLIDGFDSPPALMMPYNPPYYPRLIEACGFSKEKDLFSFIIDGEYRLPEWMESLAERLTRKKGIHIRPFRLKDPVPELALVREIFNDCWSGNWGYVPLSDHEIGVIGKSMVAIADPDLAFFIYYEDEPAGVCVILPDINPLLKRFNGRIGLSGLLKIALYRQEITGLRALLFGIKEKYRQLGLPLLAIRHLYEVVRKKGKYSALELCWTLEDNESINSLVEEAGARIHKKYCIYRKSL
ncbi:acyl-CoA N-acyltransferase [uncultured Desulfobulbus sp.]|uniref:acyl-CoA N-acyltransferase n=1 Tax=uncultured Desulfobulbus sp. TaxID=239745 RepID=UPI0029C7DF38|nr:acyl-CoA N-acyltransferase [uncultured Desulfobulbus sp.]